MLVVLILSVSFIAIGCGGSSDEPADSKTATDEASSVTIDLTTPEAALETYYSAYRQEDWKAVCAAQTTKAKKEAVESFQKFVKQLKKNKNVNLKEIPKIPNPVTCEGVLVWNNSLGETSTQPFEDIEVGDSTIEGSTAMVNVTLPPNKEANFKGGEQQVSMIKVGDEWKVKT